MLRSRRGTPRARASSLIFAVAVAALASACASSLKLDPLEGFELASPPAPQPRLLAQRDFEGSPTALAVSAEGTVFLASVHPLTGEAALRSYSPEGAEYWRIDPGLAVAGLAPLAGGAVVASGIDGTRGFGPRGEPLWRFERKCRPAALAGGEAWLCFVENAARGEPSVLRVDSQGRVVAEFRDPRDLISWDVSPDGAFVALGFRENSIVLLNPDLSRLASFRVAGEPVALAIARRAEEGRTATAAILRSADGPRLGFVGGGLERRKPLKLPAHAGSVARFEGTARAALYGNSPAGQFFAYCDAASALAAGNACALEIERRFPGFPEHASPLLADGSSALAAFEFKAGKVLTRIDFDGRLQWGLPVRGEGFLIARGSAGLIAIATDRGSLTLVSEDSSRQPAGP